MKFVLLLLLLQLYAIFSSYGQEINSKVRQATDEVCLCMQKTKTKQDERQCLKKFSSSIIDVPLSIEDSLYIKTTLRSNCGKKNDRNCSFLNESDLTSYGLKKVSQSINTIEWQVEDSTYHSVLSLTESRSDFKTQQEALDQIRQIWGSTEGNGDIVFSKKDDVFADIRVYYIEWINNIAMYQILIRKGNALQTVIITMKQDDRNMVMKVLDKVLFKMQTDCK